SVSGAARRGSTSVPTPVDNIPQSMALPMAASSRQSAAEGAYGLHPASSPGQDRGGWTEDFRETPWAHAEHRTPTRYLVIINPRPPASICVPPSDSVSCQGGGSRTSISSVRTVGGGLGQISERGARCASRPPSRSLHLPLDVAEEAAHG